ncbi:hypothetical protein R4K48_12485 [Brachyspira pulli]|uniref:hypothetical protein n=1 Tax=Brachyspira pulli TaxID=310721 RepID=UPI003004F453
MICNSKMQSFIKDIDISNITPKNYYSIFEKENSNNEKYWVISNETDCTLCKTVSVGKNLTEFEWDNNEIFISNSMDIKEVLNLALKMFVSLKKILEENYSYQKFDLVLSLSEKDDDVAPSANIRFYAVRDGYRIIDIENIENYKSESILVELVNF